MSFTTLDVINIMRGRGRGDPPSALSDVFVAPLTRVLNFLSAKMDLGRSEQTVDGILLVLQNPDLLNGMATALNETTADLTIRLKDALDDIASNFGIYRRPAAPASGSVLFMRSADPRTALPITVAAGTQITAPSIAQDYRVTTTFVVTQMTRDTARQKFVISIPVVAMGVGVTTNAAAQEVSRLKTTVTGMDSVTNPTALTGGRDLESDEELAARVKTALSTNNIGTEVGYRNTVLQVPNVSVKDATVVGAGSPLMFRDLGDGGAIDIYVTDPIPVTVSELPNASNTEDMLNGTWKFTPARQPLVNDVDAVTPSASVVEISQDNSVYSGSRRAKDYILFNVDPLTFSSPVSFQVNDLPGAVQTYIDDPSRHILGADILVRQALIALVDVTCQIAIFSGFTFSTVQANVEAAITQKISSLTIGQGLELSDVIVAIASVPGVDRVTIPFQKFNTSTETGSVNVITPAANEVLRPGNLIVSR